MTTQALDKTKTATSTGPTEADLRNMALEVDTSGADMTADSDEQTDVDRGDADPEGAEKPAADGDDPTNKDGTALAAEGTADEQALRQQAADLEAAAAAKQQQQQTATTKPESPFLKRQREIAEERKRLDDSWKKLNAEKAARRREELERTRFAEARERDRAPAVTAEDRPGHNFPVEQLIATARRLETSGKADLAELAWTEVEEARRFARAGGKPGQAPAAARPAAGENGAMGEHEFKERWAATTEIEVEQNPDLQKADSDLYKGVVAIRQAYPFLNRIPDGMKHIVAVAKLQLVAKAVPALEAKIVTMDKELTELRRATSLGGGGGSETRGGAKGFSDLTPLEQENRLRAMNAEADSQSLLAG